MKQKLNLAIEKYMEIVNILPPQIKIVALIVVMGIIFNIWRLALWLPLQDKQVKVNDAITLTIKETAMLQQNMVILRKSLLSPSPPNTVVNIEKGEVVEQESRISVLPDAIDSSIQAMNVPTQRISEILKNLLLAQHNLLLVSMQSTPIENVVDPVTKQNFLENVISIKFRGDYFSTLSYLRAITQLNWPIHWDSLYYNVINYPLAETSIQVRILSNLEDKTL